MAKKNIYKYSNSFTSSYGVFVFVGTLAGEKTVSSIAAWLAKKHQSLASTRPPKVQRTSSIIVVKEKQYRSWSSIDQTSRELEKSSGVVISAENHGFFLEKVAWRTSATISAPAFLPSRRGIFFSIPVRSRESRFILKMNCRFQRPTQTGIRL